MRSGINELAVMVLDYRDKGRPEAADALREEVRAWNARMDREGKRHMRITIDDVERRVAARRRENRTTWKAAEERVRQQSVWG